VPYVVRVPQAEATAGEHEIDKQNTDKSTRDRDMVKEE
jgi:hypothetical protein